MKLNIKDFSEKLHINNIKGWKDKKKELTIAGIVLALLLIVVFVKLLGHYDDYEVKSEVKRNDSTECKYTDYKGNLLKYSNDGAFYTNYDGDLIWNHTYEMNNPQLDICEGYVLIYDKKGNQACVLTTTGIKQTIKTNMPIVAARIANQGTVAVLLQEGDASYLKLYSLSGETIASGELYTENSGYPVAIALSSDAKKLIVSMINLNDGDVKSTLSFYNFGKAGKKQIDNIVATYSYSNMIIPEVDFVENDRAIAFGDSEIVIFNNSQKPKVAKELFVENKIKSVFHNTKYFGIVCQVQKEDGTTADEMTLYNMKGMKKFSKEIDIPYNRIEMLNNNEIMVTNGNKTNLYTTLGIKKFAYTFETGIYKIISEDHSRRYIFVEEGKTEKVKVK